MASKGRLFFSLLVAAAGAAGMGTFISAQHTPVDPIVTGSNRPDPSMQAVPLIRSAKMSRPSTPSSEEVKAFFESQLKQVRSR